MRRAALSLLVLIILAACGTPTPQAATLINVYASDAAQPWLTQLYACAASASVILNVSPDSPALTLRLGPPRGLTTPAFQVGTEDILVVVNPQSPLQSLTSEQVRDLFAGQVNPSAQVWVYPAGEDVQGVFEQAEMEGRSVVSSAKVAVNPQQMSDQVSADVNAVGLLPRHALTGKTREVFSIPSVPVLAITLSEPQGALRALIACLQK